MKHFLLFLVISVMAFGEAEPIDIFGVDANPGVGTLTYTLENDTSEKIEFGKLPGNYGFGMVFDGKGLPAQFKKDFEKNQIFQIALGVTKEKVQGKIPQFGIATLIANRIPKTKTTFRLTVPNSAELKKQDVALLLFSSPSTKLNQSDEEKLKETLFASGGSISITPQRLPTTYLVRDQTRKLTFLRQAFLTEFAAELSTPFSKTVRKLTGAIEFYYYWPKGKEATDFANKIAGESLGAMGAPPAPPAAKKK